MATISTSEIESNSHVALLPCAGMGHLLPLLRLASMLAARGCTVTIIAAQPMVSAAESDHLSRFFAVFPHIRRLDFELLPHKKSKFKNVDPFWIQMESIENSVHLLRPLLSSLSPPLAALVADFPVNSSMGELGSILSISMYTMVTTSARFFSVMSHLPRLAQEKNDKTFLDGYIDLPRLGPLSVSSIPPTMLDPNQFFAANISSNVSSLFKSKGILINTFDEFETEAIEGLRSTLAAPILPIGPLESFEADESHNLPWLDDQAPESVLFVSFGSRTALTREQLEELASGLELSGCRFLWVLKTSKVDKDDKEEVDDILGESFLNRTKNTGMVIKGWVNQEQILGHPAVGGFVSHCGWNSVTEAARLGVPILAWPQHGDQMVNAEVVEKEGLGLWSRRWREQKLVDKSEISAMIMQLMGGENTRARVKQVKAKAREAREVNGSSESTLRGVIESLKSKKDIRKLWFVCEDPNRDN